MGAYGSGYGGGYGGGYDMGGYDSLYPNAYAPTEPTSRRKSQKHESIPTVSLISPLKLTASLARVSVK